MPSCGLRERGIQQFHLGINESLIQLSRNDEVDTRHGESWGRERKATTWSLKCGNPARTSANLTANFRALETICQTADNVQIYMIQRSLQLAQQPSHVLSHLHRRCLPLLERAADEAAQVALRRGADPEAEDPGPVGLLSLLRRAVNLALAAPEPASVVRGVLEDVAGCRLQRCEGADQREVVHDRHTAIARASLEGVGVQILH